MIVDASMPAMIRTSGHMWGPDGQEADTLAVIPDSSYAGIYQAVIDDCREHGAYDPATMGSVPERRADGAGGRGVRLPRQDLRDRRRPARSASSTRPATRCSSTTSSAGDIWRACQTKDVPIRDWVKLAVTRARATGDPAVFWLDETRAHDANLIAQGPDLPRDRHDTDGLDIRDPVAGRRREALGRADPPGARTPSRSPATCCATTTPTCSRSSSSAPPPRCSRSSR